PCPPHVTPAGPYTPVKGKVTLLPSPTFTIPADDILLLKSKDHGCSPSVLALWQTAALFKLSEERTQKYITLGRKEKGSQ
ncbi:hypothetical protein, partial [Candidatus Methylomirabilis sp.]|uniref:hypothetical protein n=1 Tax=Candidatus Methylomirabilis sp. TaxID=2032687 RepID=UPI003C7668AD